MTVRTLTPELVDQRVRAVLGQRHDARIIALRGEPRWDDGPIDVDGRRVTVRPCPSPLAVRAALTEWDTQARTGDRRADDLLVVVCDATDAELGSDVLARLDPAKILSVDPWSAAQALFGVRRLDAAFKPADGWIAEALLAHVDRELARSMTIGGVLTIEVALDTLAQALLGAEAFAVDALLAASTGPAPFAGLEAAAEPTRAGLIAAIAARLAPLGTVVAAAVDAGRGDELVAAGVAARAVYGTGDRDGGRAAGRLEARYGSLTLAPSVGAMWATRSEAVLADLLDRDVERGREVLVKADALADDLSASTPEASRFLSAGFDRSVAIAAGLIDDLLTDTAAAATPLDQVALDRVARAVEQVAEHHDARSPLGSSRATHLEMAARLVVWLATAPDVDTTASFDATASSYAAHGAWVDRARRRLWRGDGDPQVGAVYRRVIDAVVARRRTENQHLAERLVSVTARPADPSSLFDRGLVPVEDVIDRVVAPLARRSGVLFVVLDGCGLPSFLELGPQLAETGYREVAPGGGDDVVRRLVGIAALPTVTEVSRASLLAGRLDQGNQEHERRQLEAHQALTSGGRRAVLFHQNRLLGPAGSALAPAVEDALRDEGTSVVAAVINTIDDQLKRGTFTEELRLGDLHSLVALLDAARTHGLTVVISADHGHVLSQPDDGGTGAHLGGGSGGERWRDADRAPNEVEVLLKGERVLLGGERGVLAPWDDDFRYAARAGGYHGGATPEEVLVPVAVLVPAGLALPNGWEPVAQVPPLWWDLRVAAPAAAPEPPRPPSRKAPKPAPEGQQAMFEPPTPPPAPPSVVAGPAWIDALLASEVWAVQKGAAGRARLPEDRVRAVLAALEQRGGVSSFAAIATDSGVPSHRLPGLLALLARVLNVEGYVVLDVDAGAAEARLSMPLLAQQFEIEVGG